MKGPVTSMCKASNELVFVSMHAHLDSLGAPTVIYVYYVALLPFEGYRPDQLGDGILESEQFHNKSYNLTEEECYIKNNYTPLLTLPYVI